MESSSAGTAAESAAATSSKSAETLSGAGGLAAGLGWCRAPHILPPRHHSHRWPWQGGVLPPGPGWQWRAPRGGRAGRRTPAAWRRCSRGGQPASGTSRLPSDARGMLGDPRARGGGGELDEVGEGELAHIWRLIWPPAQTHEYECRCACAYMHACVCACARVYVLIHTHMQRRWPMLEGTANTLFAIVPFFFPSCIQGKIMRPLPFHPGFTFFSFCFIWWSSFFAS